eukprot:TRINITY_DN10482_c0_g1_i1.p1 TRINITY_DN10482_c0_g1~~TRINITY_DN10482_c0_g1_i1.p1  ORF type:complete len:519 (+),score=126.20 TRINITY_DN10482_c0_g1_i1:313-1869(+)
MAEGSDEAVSELREALRRNSGELLTLRPLRGRLSEIEEELGKISEQALVATLRNSSHCRSGVARAIEFPESRSPIDEASSSSMGSESERFHGHTNCEEQQEVGLEADEDEDEDLEEESSWETTMDLRGLLPTSATDPVVVKDNELELVTSHLHAADDLADRVVHLENALVARGSRVPPLSEFVVEGAEVEEDLSQSQSLAVSGPLHARVYRLSQAVGGLQAHLMDIKLHLQESVDCNDGDQGPVPCNADMVEEKLRTLASELEELEQAMAEDFDVAALQGLEEEEDAIADGLEEDFSDQELHSASIDHLSAIADRLAPLEDVFRTLSDHLVELGSPGALLGGIEAKAVETNGTSAEVKSVAKSVSSDCSTQAVDTEVSTGHFRVLVSKAFGCHEKDIASMREDLSQAQEALAQLSDQVKTAYSRLDAVEAMDAELRAGFLSQQRRQEAPNCSVMTMTAGQEEAKASSPLKSTAEAKARLDSLDKQMNDLQLRMKGSQAHTSIEEQHLSQQSTPSSPEL